MRETNRAASSSSALPDPRLERWLVGVIETPGLTGIENPAEARRVLLDGALEASGVVSEGPVVDVGSGGGSPGIPLASAHPELDVVLLESSRRKCEFLTAVATEFENASVVCARAEEHAAGVGRDVYGTAVARALAPPPVAAELCLPLVRPGGSAILFVGPSAQRSAVAAAAAELAAELLESPPGLLVLAKTGPTPERFPRRPGIAKKRPLA